jgi:hypothetical protein
LTTDRAFCKARTGSFDFFALSAFFGLDAFLFGLDSFLAPEVFFGLVGFFFAAFGLVAFFLSSLPRLRF